MQEPAQLGIFREMRLAIAAMVALIAVGTAGYVLIENYGPLDAFYMTIITIFTVGFSEVHPLKPAGRVFTAFLIMFGAGVALWAVASVLQLAVNPQARLLLRRRRMKSEIAKMREHFIVCGYGRIGREVCRVFGRRGVPFAVGDVDERAVAELLEAGYPVIQGNCTEDETLRALGIERARGLVAVAGTDADNTFIVLSARALRPDLYVVARAASPEVEGKLRAAGANRVITPYRIGGQRIAAAAVQPTIVDFLDVAMHGDEMALALDEIRVLEGASLIGRTLVDSGIRQQSGAVIVAIKHADGRLNSNPAPETPLSAGDILIALGTTQQLKSLQALAG